MAFDEVTQGIHNLIVLLHEALGGEVGLKPVVFKRRHRGVVDALERHEHVGYSLNHLHYATHPGDDVAAVSKGARLVESDSKLLLALLCEQTRLLVFKSTREGIVYEGDDVGVLRLNRVWVTAELNRVSLHHSNERRVEAIVHDLDLVRLYKLVLRSANI